MTGGSGAGTADPGRGRQYGRPRRSGPSAGGRLPLPGDNLVVSLDSRVQRTAQSALRYGIDIARRNGEPGANGGAAVVLDAKSGAVIALASDPSYDANVWSGGISEGDFRKLSRPAANYPLIDRADEGLYPTGSTFKAVGAIAALEEGSYHRGRC